MSLSNAGLWAAVVVTAFIAVMGLTRPQGGIVERIVGASAGPVHTALQEFEGGVKYGNSVSTTTALSTAISAAEFRQWVDADVVIINPTGAAAAKTITFPASSTVSAALPQAGDMTKTCFYNATTSVAAQIIFAGGTGTPLNVASSTATVLGGANILAGEVGCFTFIRGASMPTAFDITANFTTFK
jgi:hypothetical protein